MASMNPPHEEWGEVSGWIDEHAPRPNETEGDTSVLCSDALDRIASLLSTIERSDEYEVHEGAAEELAEFRRLEAEVRRDAGLAHEAATLAISRLVGEGLGESPPSVPIGHPDD